MVSILANTYDRDFKLLNGTHKSHVHSPREVCDCVCFPSTFIGCLIQPWIDLYNYKFPLDLLQAEILASYKPVINSTNLIRELKQVQKTMTKALEYFNSTRHIVLYYEDVLKNQTVRLPPNGGSWFDVLLSYTA